MGISAIVDSLDDIPESVQDFYAADEKTGKYVLDIEGVDDHPKVRGVITANANNKQTRDKLKQQLSEFESRFSWVPEDFDADAFEALRDAAEGKGGAPTDEQLASMRDKLSEKLAKKYTTEIETKDGELSSLKGALNRMVVDEGLSRAADAARIDPDFKDAAIALLKQSAKIEVTQDGDAFKAVIDTDMGPQSIPDFVAEWAAGTGKKFVAKSTGPDPKGGNAGGKGKTVTRSQWDAMSHADRAETAKAGMKVVDD